MKLIQQEQGSQVWLDWRKTLITASDVPAIMGLSPYSTARELWDRKKGHIPEVQDNPGMKRGRELEPRARILAEDQIDGFFQPACGQSEEYPFMGASFDGLELTTGDVLEVKCPSEEDHLMAITGEVPPKYQPQIQTQAIVSECQWLYYVSYRPGADQELVVIKKSGAELRMMADQAGLPMKVKAFWESLSLEEYPIAQEQAELAAAWAKAHIRLSEAEEDEKRLRERLLGVVDQEAERQEVNGVLITRTIRQGSVDYKAVLKALSIDPPEDILNQSRKKDSISFRLSLRASRVDQVTAPTATQTEAEVGFSW